MTLELLLGAKGANAAPGYRRPGPATASRTADEVRYRADLHGLRAIAVVSVTLVAQRMEGLFKRRDAQATGSTNGPVGTGTVP